MFWIIILCVVLVCLYGLGSSTEAWDLEDVIHDERITINKFDPRNAVASTPEGAVIAKAVDEKDFATIGAVIAKLEAERFKGDAFYHPLYERSYGYAMDLLCQNIAKKWLPSSQIKQAHLVMDDLDRYLADHDDHIVATMLADVFQQVGYIYRGHDTIDKVSDKNIERFSYHYQQADALLEKYKSTKSPLVYQSRVNLFAGLDGGQKLLADRFQELLDTEPKDMGVYAQRVRFLLPRWGGSWEQIEVLARKCYAENVDGLGAAHYAYIIIKAAMNDLEMSAYWDDEMLEEGMYDLAATNDQILVNSIMGFIIESNYKVVETMYGDEIKLEKPNWKAVLSSIIRNNLHEVETTVWCCDEDYFEMTDAKEVLHAEFVDEFVHGVTRVDFTAGHIRYFRDEVEVSLVAQENDVA